MSAHTEFLSQEGACTSAACMAASSVLGNGKRLAGIAGCETCWRDGLRGCCMCSYDEERILDKLGCPLLRVWALPPNPEPFRTPPPKFRRLGDLMQSEADLEAADTSIHEIFADRVKCHVEESRQFSLEVSGRISWYYFNWSSNRTATEVCKFVTSHAANPRCQKQYSTSE